MTKPSLAFRNVLKALRNTFQRALAHIAPWDGKLDEIDAKLARLEVLLEHTQALAALHLTDRAYVEEMFLRAHGYAPNLETPRTFNEKLAWTKLHRRQPIYAELTDKSRAKHYVREHLGPAFVIETLAECESVHELDFTSLPSSFILKPTHGSGWTIVVRDKAAANLPAIKRTLHGWMSTNYFRFQREPQYRPLIPALIAERLLLDAHGELPSDFKFHCFHGRVGFVQMDTDRHTKHRRNFYDRDWEPQPFDFSPANAEGDPLYAKGPPAKRPAAYDALLQTAEKLAAPFDYVRVDLYCVDDAIFFGELTFNHGAASELFFPRKWDRVWGDLWQLDSR